MVLEIEGLSHDFHSLVMFNLAACSKCMTTDRQWTGYFSTPICSRAASGVGDECIPVMVERRVNIWFQNELRDLQNQSTWAIVPVLPHFLQQEGGCP